MRIAFDSRPATDPRGIGRYVRCLRCREVLGERATFVERDDLAGLLAAAATARRPAAAPPAWTWEDAARATWTVYAEAATIRS
jgi:hypothetical protein